MPPSNYKSTQPAGSVVFNRALPHHLHQFLTLLYTIWTIQACPITPSPVILWRFIPWMISSPRERLLRAESDGRLRCTFRTLLLLLPKFHVIHRLFGAFSAIFPQSFRVGPQAPYTCLRCIFDEISGTYSVRTL